MSGVMNLAEHTPTHIQDLDGMLIAPSWLSGGANFGHPCPAFPGQRGGIALRQAHAVRDESSAGRQDDQGSLPLL